MTENRLAYQTQGTVIESVVIGGDLSRLTAEQRVEYYKTVCESMNLNPYTRPFDYITLNGKLTLYARKDAADQLRKIHGVSIDDVEINEIGDSYFVKVKGHDATGRADVEIGVVSKKDMQGNIANVQMKAVTKAKRRLTLSICGLGWLDETEVDTIPNAQPVVVDDNGVIEAEVLPAPVHETELDLTPVPLDATSKMSLEMAETETNSKGVKYSEIETDKLTHMFNTMSKLGKKTDEHIRKMDAIKTILSARNGG
jgi:hypothetical protein